MLERKVYNNDDIRILTFAKPSCDNVLQPSPLRGSDCNTLSHSGLANVNIWKRMFYPLIITKNSLNMVNSADPDETPHFAASHLGLRCLKILPFYIICINPLTSSQQLCTLNFRQATSLFLISQPKHMVWVLNRTASAIKIFFLLLNPNTCCGYSF